MKIKIMGFLVIMLFIGTATLPALATTQIHNDTFEETIIQDDNAKIYGEVKLAMHLPPDVYYYPVEDAKITARLRVSFPFFLFIVRWILGKIEVYNDYTDSSGYYELDVEPGKYVVFCTWDGDYDMPPFPRFIDVKSGDSIQLEEFLFWDYP